MWGFEFLLENDYEMIEDFMQWAFGDDFDSLFSQDVPAAWNKRHGDLYNCKGFGNPRDDLEIMVKLWRETDGKD